MTNITTKAGESEIPPLQWTRTFPPCWEMAVSIKCLALGKGKIIRELWMRKREGGNLTLGITGLGFVLRYLRHLGRGIGSDLGNEV